METVFSSKWRWSHVEQICNLLWCSLERDTIAQLYQNNSWWKLDSKDENLNWTIWLQPEQLCKGICYLSEVFEWYLSIPVLRKTVNSVENTIMVAQWLLKRDYARIVRWNRLKMKLLYPGSVQLWGRGGLAFSLSFLFASVALKLFLKVRCVHVNSEVSRE